MNFLFLKIFLVTITIFFSFNIGISHAVVANIAGDALQIAADAINDISEVTIQSGIFKTALFFVATGVIVLLSFAAAFLLFTSQVLGMYIGGFGAIFINVGYYWLLSTVNTFFVIVLAFVALLYILDIEEGIVDKKTIPRLIIAAILMNFSLVFVESILDFFIVVENSIINTIIPDGITYSIFLLWFTASINYLIFTATPHIIYKGKLKLTTALGSIFFAIPDFLFSIATTFALPLFIAPTIFQIVTNTVLIFVFFVYGSLFLARFVMVHLLAMVAPLMFFAMVFPKTRKYFDSWLKQLITWGFMGAVIFASLGFGFYLWQAIINFDDHPAIAGLVPTFSSLFGPIGDIIIDATFFFYLANLFLAVYSIVMFIVIKKYLPAGAQGIMNIAQRAVTTTAMAGGTAVTGTVGGMAISKYGGKVSGIMDKVSEDLGGGDTMLGRIAMDAKHLTEKKVQEVTQKRAKYNKDKTPSQIEEELEQMKIDENETEKPIDKTKQAALLLALNAKGGFKKVNSKKLKKWGMDNKEFEEALRYGGIDPEAEDALAAYRGERDINEGVKKVKDMQALKPIDDDDAYNANIEMLETLKNKEMEGKILSEKEKKEKEKLEKEIEEKIKEQQIKNSEDMAKIIRKSSEDEIKVIGNALKGDNLEAFVKSVFYNTSDPAKMIAVCGDNMQKAGEKFKEFANEMTEEQCLAFVKDKKEFLERTLTAEPPIFPDCDYQILQQGLESNADRAQRTDLYNAVRGLRTRRPRPGPGPGTSPTSTEEETSETGTEE